MKNKKGNTTMIQNIDISRLIPHPNNPRKNLGDLTELADSIKENGIFQNLTVVPVDASDYEKKIAMRKKYTGDYTIIIGHRRHSAAKHAGLSEVPCAVTLIDEKTQLSTMLCENIQRSDLTIIEQAQGFQMMLDLGETTKTISEKTGFSETTVRKRLFVASLDKKKANSAYERGATLDDYIKLQQIDNAKKRNEVLESIGTNNFNNSFANAVAEEKREKIAPQIVEQIKEFAKPTEKLLWELKGYSSRYEMRISYTEYEKSGKLGFKIPTKFKPDEYLYHLGKNYIDIYKKDKNIKVEKKMTELSPQEQEEKREFRRNYKALKEMSETAYQLRLDFIKSFSKNPKLLHEHYEALSYFSFAAVCLGNKLEFSNYASLEEISFNESYWQLS
ncbi:MAG: ParB/RepB/Spo0J family partition protein [Oscillospiraceae bacterium]|nr:ParB/RepB/Spo0J family partition protein [Oscillospiraceae bacterium]